LVEKCVLFDLRILKIGLNFDNCILIIVIIIGFGFVFSFPNNKSNGKKTKKTYENTQ